MSQLESFRDALRARIETRANASINLMGQIRWRPAQVASPVSNPSSPAPSVAVAIPSTTIEDIALAHTLYQAEAQVLTEAIRFIDEEYRKAMGQPAEENNPERSASLDRQEAERKKGHYG